MNSTASHRVVVVGAGILGASIAWHLARRGADVTVVDEGKPSNRATHGSFAWINAHDPADQTYFQLRLHSMRLWREMVAEMPDLPVRFDGTLNWEDAPDDMDEVRRQLDEGGNPARLVGRSEIAALEPALSAPPEIAIDASAEGVADPAAIAERLLLAALSAGATLRTNAKVLSVTFSGDRVSGVEIPEGVVEADTVVLATGCATAELLGDHGFALPMDNAPGLLIRTSPMAAVTRRVLTSMALHVWQKDDGSLLLGEDFGGTDPSEGVEVIVNRVLEKLRGQFGGMEDAAVVGTTVMHRPKPADGRPALGRVPGLDGLVAATTHSGITLAPVIGALLSDDIIGDRENAELRPYRVARFKTKAKA